MTATNQDTLALFVEEGYLRLADLLEQLPDERWDTNSLCHRWRIREVVAHMTMPVRYSEEAFTAELRECGFDFTRLSNKLAERDGALHPKQLLEDLRRPALHEWQPPGGGAEGALNHLVIHSLDVTVPLRAAPCSSEDALRIVLDQLTRGGGHAHFGTDVSGRAFEATDLEWSFGSGIPERDSAAEIVLRLSGRRSG